MSLQVHAFRPLTTLSATLTLYTAAINGQRWEGTEGLAQVLCTAAGTFSNFSVVLPTAPGVGKSFTFTLRINGADTAAVVAISGTATSGTYTATAIALADGDELAIKCVPSGTPALSLPSLAWDFTSTTPGESIYGLAFHATGTGLSASVSQRVLSGSAMASWSASSSVRDVVGCAGAITKATIKLDADVGASGTVTFTITKNGVAQDGAGGTPDTRIAFATGTTKASATFTLPVAPGDLLTWSAVESGSIANVRPATGVRLLATTPGQSHFGGTYHQAVSNAATRYHSPAQGSDNTAVTSTESAHAVTLGLTGLTLRNLQVAVSGASGGGLGWTLALRKNGADGGNSVTVLGAATTGSNSSATVCAPGDTLALQTVPVGTAASVIPGWAWLQDQTAAETAPIAETVLALPVGFTTATLNAWGTPNGVAIDGFFRWDTVSPPVTNTTAASALGTGLAPVPFYVDLTGLTPGATYYFVAVVDDGTTEYLGDILSFTTIGTTNHGFGSVSPGVPLEVYYASTADPLYVFLSWFVNFGGFNNTFAVSGITFDGVALTRGGHKAVKGNTMEWWRLAAPTAGVGIVSVTTNASKQVSIGIMNLAGFPAALADHTFDASGESASRMMPFLRLPTGAGATVVHWLGFNNEAQSDVLPDSGSTEVWNEEGLGAGDQVSAGATKVGLAPSTPISWGFNETNEHWGLAAISYSAGNLQKVTQQVLLVGVDEDVASVPPLEVTPCVGGGDVADGTNPAAGSDLSTATVPIAWVELELVDGTRLRYAKAAIPHGLPKFGRVLRFGRVARRLTDGDGGPQASVVTTQLADTDRALRAAAWAGTLHFALVEYFVADLTTIQAGGTPHRVFRGRVQDWTADANLTLTLTVQDELSARLTSAHATDTQSPIRTIDATMHDYQPIAPLLGKAAPEIYGSLSDAHEAPPIGEAGTWELRHIADQTIDPGPFAELGQLAIFLVCSGAVSQIQQVYAADPAEDPPVTRRAVPASAYGQWLFVPGKAWFSEESEDQWWEDSAGRRWTVLAGLREHPSIALAVAGRIPIVVNLCGYEDFGDSTGETLERPARAFLHWLNNRVVQDTPGDWAPIFSLGDYSLFDTTTFDTVDLWCETRGYRVAGVIGYDYEFVSWRDRVAEWCLNFGFELGVNKHGQVICAVLDAAAPTVATLSPATILEGGCQVTMRNDAVENIVPYVYKRNYVTSIQALNPLAGTRGLRDPVDGEWQSDREEVTDEASITALGGHPRGERRARLQEYSLVREATTADQVAAARLALHARPNGRAEVTFDLFLRDGAALELGDVVAIEHWDLPWTGPCRCHVRILELDLDELTVTTTVRDVEDLLS